MFSIPFCFVTSINDYNSIMIEIKIVCSYVDIEKVVGAVPTRPTIKLSLIDNYKEMI